MAAAVVRLGSQQAVLDTRLGTAAGMVAGTVAGMVAGNAPVVLLLLVVGCDPARMAWTIRSLCREGVVLRACPRCMRTHRGSWKHATPTSAINVTGCKAVHLTSSSDYAGVVHKICCKHRSLRATKSHCFLDAAPPKPSYSQT